MGGMGALHDRLHGGLWHTTHPRRFLSIIASGGLRVEPGLSNLERWKAQRPEHYPLVRLLGGVSLFDFANFDARRYSETHPMSSWHHFVPHRRDWGVAVWIGIARAAVADNFISADALVELWDQPGKRGHTIMPRIEAAHIGDLPKSAFASAFLTWENGCKIHDIDLSADQIDVDPILQHFGNATSNRPPPPIRKSPPQRPSLKLTTFLTNGQLAWPVAQKRGISEALFYARLKKGMTPDDVAYTPVMPRGWRFHRR
ncbi:hypothetical protein PV773_13190 [Mesorhizobium sp. CC13]|uniref:hypothetical protein n=1 Tax=Mesorhizobium sp. CC13 TaxID=3029194 RepID=UPI0032641295